MKLTWPKRSRPAAESRGTAATQVLRVVESCLLDADLLSDIGCVRTNNEDAGRLVRDPDNSSRLLAIVCDGMGGHNAGEVASAMAAEALEDAFPAVVTDPARTLRRTVEDANRRVYADAQSTPDRKGMGTTCTALLLQNGHAYSAHLGDSRIYLLRNGGIYLVTEDHSQVFEMVKAGVLTLAEARHHPDKNVITRALGRQPQVEVATWPEPLPVHAGDGFLLCSDGLCDVLEDDEMNAIVSARNAADSCEELVRLAKARNASDNITVAVIKLVARNLLASTAAGTGAPNPKNSTHGARPTRRVERHP